MNAQVRSTCSLKWRIFAVVVFCGTLAVGGAWGSEYQFERTLPQIYWYPSGVAVDNAGNVYVADTYNTDIVNRQ